ncbi:MAG: NAD(P)H-dependent glycerol-3-phosphate dehydrogenase [Holosporales bacterium]|jgi:glycerol-3-phosphate dehydrogenase (NAD(P)+)|nr:NAD(P)H-dependent glycerol-3-phosphate dehydrogenase [Holosporales bacterium]
MKRLSVLGAGAFGTALALMYSSKFKVRLFSWFEDHVASMRRTRVNEFLSDHTIDGSIDIEVSSNMVRGEADYILWAFPLKPTISLLEALSDKLDGATIVLCSKGLLPDGKLLSDAFIKLVPNSKVGYLAGPNFAGDIAAGRMSAADILFSDHDYAVAMSRELSTGSLKLNPSSDVIGAQICGAMKNVIAIACGIAVGLSPSPNTNAALITFGLREMRNLGIAANAEESTFYGLCGIGDLILTAFNEESRNFTFGKRIANGESAEEIMACLNAACEGYYTAQHVVTLAKKHSVEVPICEAVCKILFEHAPPDTILNAFR